MSKKREVINHQEQEDYWYANAAMEADATTATMLGLVEASNYQMNLALELTKLMVERVTTPINEDNILAFFKRASHTIMEAYPLQKLFDNLD